MKQLMKLAAAAATGAIASGTIVYAQAAAPAEPRAIVSLYRTAPGQQEALLRWLAGQDRVAKSAGVAPMQLYVHTDGDSWDYMGINPMTTAAQDQALDAAAQKMGVTGGPRASLELRKYIAEHTDTYTVGPITAEQALARYGSR
jgi:ABC-type glycerol-3-phosphate transport system substrate-binding protein